MQHPPPDFNTALKAITDAVQQRARFLQGEDPIKRSPQEFCIDFEYFHAGEYAKWYRDFLDLFIKFPHGNQLPMKSADHALKECLENAILENPANKDPKYPYHIVTHIQSPSNFDFMDYELLHGLENDVNTMDSLSQQNQKVAPQCGANSKLMRKRSDQPLMLMNGRNPSFGIQGSPQRDIISNSMQSAPERRTMQIPGRNMTSQFQEEHCAQNVSHQWDVRSNWTQSAKKRRVTTIHEINRPPQFQEAYSVQNVAPQWDATSDSMHSVFDRSLAATNERRTPSQFPEGFAIKVTSSNTPMYFNHGSDQHQFNGHPQRNQAVIAQGFKTMNGKNNSKQSSSRTNVITNNTKKEEQDRAPWYNEEIAAISRLHKQARRRYYRRSKEKVEERKVLKEKCRQLKSRKQWLIRRAKQQYYGYQ